MTGIYYLEYHDAAKNSHKFYAGNPQTGDVLYGRVGAKGTLKRYDLNKVSTMKYEKQNKGYSSVRPIPQYVLDTLRTDEDKAFFDFLEKKVKPAKVSANQGLLNWFSGIDRL